METDVKIIIYDISFRNHATWPEKAHVERHGIWHSNGNQGNSFGKSNLSEKFVDFLFASSIVSRVAVRDRLRCVFCVYGTV